MFDPPMKNKVFKPARREKIRSRRTIFWAGIPFPAKDRHRHGFAPPVSRSESNWSRLNPEIGGDMRKPDRKEY